MLLAEMARCAALYFRQITCCPPGLCVFGLLQSGLLNERDQDFRKFLALVFLQEMSRIANLYVLAILRARNSGVKRMLGTASDGVAVAEGSQERFFPV